MLGFHVEDDAVSLALLGLVVARLLGLLGYLLHLGHHLNNAKQNIKVVVMMIIVLPLITIMIISIALFQLNMLICAEQCK